METLDLIALAKQCPDVTISVKASDLISWGRSLKEELLQDLRDNNLVKTKKEVEDFITREEAMEKLKVSSATLWRWKKSDYLVPVKLGALDRYRVVDINRILSKKGGAL